MYYVSVFISHSWSYSGHYDKLAEWIFETPWNLRETPIQFANTSVPKDNPIHNAPTSAALKAAIYERIAQSHVVVIPTGMYANYSHWIQREIDGAQYYGKPILAVNPLAQERKSSIVAQVANRTVGWNAQSVVDGVWALAPLG